MKLKDLSKRLANLKDEASLYGLKGGTEVEDMDDAELLLFRQISLQNPEGHLDGPIVVPLVIKIGGPEARRDIRFCTSIGADGILAPMVESTYALKNFVEAAQTIVAESQNTKKPLLSFNLETRTAYANLDNFFDCSSMVSITQITIGRGDFSQSMHLSVDDEEVQLLTRSILQKIQRNGKESSVGGGLSLNNIRKMADSLPATRFNTRHMIIKNDSSFRADPQAKLLRILELEIDLYGTLAEAFPSRELYYQKRTIILKERIKQGDFI